MQASLPPEQRIAFRHKKVPLDAATLNRHDAALLLCAMPDAEALLQSLPHSAALQSVYANELRAKGSVSTLSLLLPQEKPCFLAIGFLKPGASTFEQLSLAGRLWKAIGNYSPQSVVLGSSGFEAKPAQATLEVLLAAVLAGAAPMPRFKSKAETAPRLKSLTLLSEESSADFSATLATHAGNHLARWLTLLPPNQLDCSAYRRLLQTLAAREGWEYEFLDEKALQKLGAGAFLAVSRANAHRDAGIVKLSRTAAGKARRARIALVGKGICFDTGGINLKSHKSMYDMHTDMQGSAVAVGALLALSQLKAPFDIECWLAITENEIGPKAYRPQEVVTAANGVTIQVVHSDAEGRMALADTLALAARAKPKLILDFATLTGACVAALTERMSGAFTNRADWHEAIVSAGHTSGERVWNFPMDTDFDSDLDSPLADIMQCTLDNKGDHILAARFLQRFVPEDIPWIHIDLSSGNRSGGLAHIPTEVTGFGVRFATELLLRSGLLQSSKA